jgi:hypothetical protein
MDSRRNRQGVTVSDVQQPEGRNPFQVIGYLYDGLLLGMGVYLLISTPGTLAIDFVQFAFLARILGLVARP